MTLDIHKVSLFIVGYDKVKMLWDILSDSVLLWSFSPLGRCFILLEMVLCILLSLTTVHEMVPFVKYGSHFT